MTLHYLLAAGWTWPAAFVVVACVGAFAFVAVASMARNFASRPIPGVTSSRLTTLEEDLGAIREDLAEIKETLAELDRMFKSVG